MTAITHRAEGLFYIGAVETTLLTGQIALAATEPFGRHGETETIHIALTPQVARELGEWLIAASRVSADLEAGSI